MAMFENPFTLGLLKKFEGYTAKPKWDHKQYSVGYSTRWQPGQPIGTRQDHEAALANEAGNVDSYISQNVKVPLDDNKRAALTSFGFNLGSGAIGRLLPDINANNWDRVGQRMLSFSRAGDNPNALIDRRRQETELLLGKQPASGGGGDSMQAGSGYLTKALNAAGVIPGQAQQPAGGPVPLTAPNMRYSKLADALLASAAGAKPKGWGDLLNSAGDLALGYTLSNKADKEQSAYKSSLSQALMGANDTDAMARTLMSSGDEDLVKQGVALKVAQNKPQSNSERFMTIPGVGVMDMNTRQVVPGTEPKKQEGLMSVAPGNTILDPNSRQPVYTAPAKPEEKKYQFTKYGIGDPTTGEIKPYAEGEGGDVEYNKNLTYGVDEDNNVVPLQAGNNATIARSKLPPGVKINGKDPVRLDIGTEFVLLDPVTRQVIGRVPKDVAGEQAAQEVGKLGGQAQVALPAAKTMVDNAIATIGELRKHPGLDTGTGASNVFDPRSWAPGTDAYDFLSKNKQATGQSFMAARDALKGAGQVTDFEGSKGEQAVANLDAAQSKGQYLSALDNLEKMMRASYADLERKAAGGRAPAAPGGGTPAPGGAPTPAPTTAPKSAPPQAIDMLKANPTPQMRQYFDATFGLGAADRVLSAPQSLAPSPQELQSAYGMVQ